MIQTAVLRIAAPIDIAGVFSHVCQHVRDNPHKWAFVNVAADTVTISVRSKNAEDTIFWDITKVGDGPLVVSYYGVDCPDYTKTAPFIIIRLSEMERNVLIGNEWYVARVVME